MKRRSIASAIALTGLVLGVGAASTLAAGKPGHKVPARWITYWVRKPSLVDLNCKIYMATVPPPGSDAVVPPVASGHQYGHTVCPAGLYSETGTFGSGLFGDRFNTPASGDMVGEYTAYFRQGEIAGRFDLAPQSSSFGSFTSQTWKGTMTVTFGSGLYKLAQGTAPGKMNCQSPDQVHLTCASDVGVKLMLPVKVHKRVTIHRHA